jgi:hypothetical protein
MSKEAASRSTGLGEFERLRCSSINSRTVNAYPPVKYTKRLEKSARKGRFQGLFCKNSQFFPLLCILKVEQGENMSLKKEYVRDGKRRIVGSVTTGFSDESATVRDEQNHIIGRTSERFHTTRDNHGNLVSLNSSDPGLLIGRKK